MSNHERVAIVGTAQSWKTTPWQDQGLAIWSLNDAYRLPGFVRADRWYDLHPLHKFIGVPPEQKGIFAHQIPAGSYVRPSGYLDWLASQTIPIYLHPDYTTQHPAAANWAHARPFPKADLEAEFGRYFTSSPAWMIAHAVSAGVKELHIYGIHLATEHEYIEQRPNFEYLIGRVLGGGPLKTVHTKTGMRWHETPHGVVILPEASPILNSNFQYAFDVRPNAYLEPMKWDAHRYTVKRHRAAQALIDRKWYQRKAPLKEELLKWDAYLQDTHDRIQRAQLAQHWT